MKSKTVVGQAIKNKNQKQKRGKLKMANELSVNVETGEIIEQTGMKVISETQDFIVVQDLQTGKFSRKAKFNDYSSVKVETREEKLWLLGIMEADEDTGNPLRQHVGKEIVVQDIITRKYDKINEDTGELEYGVLTYLITPEKQAFVTSSKTVYFSITRIMELLGQPHEDDWENITVKVGSEKGANGTIIKIRMVG